MLRLDDEAVAIAPSSKENSACATHCPYCALQCGMNLVHVDGRISVEKRDFPTNRGGLCRKGWTAAELLSHPDRLTTPLIRDSRKDPFRPASWEEALNRIAEKTGQAQESYGLDAAGVFGGGGADQ